MPWVSIAVGLGGALVNGAFGISQAEKQKRAYLEGIDKQLDFQRSVIEDYTRGKDRIIALFVQSHKQDIEVYAQRAFISERNKVVKEKLSEIFVSNIWILFLILLTLYHYLKFKDNEKNYKENFDAFNTGGSP